MTDILQFIRNLDKVVEGFANPDNLLYGPEIKFYSNKIDIDNNFETLYYPAFNDFQILCYNSSCLLSMGMPGTKEDSLCLLSLIPKTEGKLSEALFQLHR